jgi:low affinity Fe/Cu permease
MKSRHTDIFAVREKLSQEIRSVEAIKRNAERVLGIETRQWREVRWGVMAIKRCEPTPLMFVLQVKYLVSACVLQFD